MYTDPSTLTLWRTVQSILAGDALRYGDNFAHHILPILFLILTILALLRAFRIKNKINFFFLVQGIFPLILFFTVAPIFKLRLPLHETKQFVVLLPAIYIIIAGGLTEICIMLSNSNAKRIISCSLIGSLILFINIMPLHAYFTQPKSPEGLAVLRLRKQYIPGEIVISLHYSTTYALAFYTRDIPIYLEPKQESDTYKYQVIDSENIFVQSSIGKMIKDTADIRATGRFWILVNSYMYREPLESLITDCQMLSTEYFPPINSSFELLHVDCNNSN